MHDCLAQYRQIQRCSLAQASYWLPLTSNMMLATSWSSSHVAPTEIQDMLVTAGLLRQKAVSRGVIRLIRPQIFLLTRHMINRSMWQPGPGSTQQLSNLTWAPPAQTRLKRWKRPSKRKWQLTMHDCQPVAQKWRVLLAQCSCPHIPHSSST